MSAVTMTRVASVPAEATEQHSVRRSLALHILPGLLIGSVFVISVPLAMRMGFPPLFAMVTAGIAVGLSFQLWHLLNEGRRRNGIWSLEGIVLYREPMPLWQYFAWVPLFTVAAFVVNALTSPIGTALLNALPWLPGWFEMRDLSTLAPYPRSALFVTFALYLLLNGLAAPIVEELYFRGYLLPRIPASKRWAPFTNILLFSLYHFFTPWQNLTRILAFLPLSYAVASKRNIYISMWAHCLLNTSGMVIAFVL